MAAASFRWIRAAFAPAVVALAMSAAPSRAEGIRVEALTIPAVVGGSETVDLDAIVLRPDDRSAHPLAVINHGSPREASDRPGMSPYGMWAEARAFARRGWVAVAFLRRGYGRSQGGWTESYGSCANPDYARAGRAGASDIAAVAKFMASEPYVSPGKWISVGVSAGAFATVALTADAPPGLAAAISFAPGRGSESADTVCGESRLVAAFAQYGKTSRIPLLWVSAENDRFFGPRLVDLTTAAFSHAGGNATVVRTPPFGEDGHALFSAKGLPVWSPIVDRFLKANDLALRDELIALAAPKAPPRLDARGRDAFQSYVDGAPNKAFAVGGAHFGWATGRRTADQAKRDALNFCASSSSECALVNVNDEPAK